MRRHLPLLMLSSLLLGGCFATTPKEEHFYHLSGPSAVTAKGTGPTLEVLSFSSASGYDSPRLAYRVAANELRFYAHHKWAAEPAGMVREMLANHLRASGKFSAVGGGSKSREPDAYLSGVLVAMEEVDAGKTWQARLAMRLVLTLASSDEVLMRHAFDVSLPCASRHPREVAVSISKALAQQARVMAPTRAAAGRAATSAAPVKPDIPQPDPAPAETVDGP